MGGDKCTLCLMINACVGFDVTFTFRKRTSHLRFQETKLRIYPKKKETKLRLLACMEV